MLRLKSAKGHILVLRPQFVGKFKDAKLNFRPVTTNMEEEISTIKEEFSENSENSDMKRGMMHMNQNFRSSRKL